MGIQLNEKTIGEILRELRFEANLSTRDLAGIVNIPKSTISAYERNEMQLKANHIIILADYFNVSADYLLGREARK